MAKKVVASLKDKTKQKNFSKLIRAVKSPKTGAYTFKEEMMPSGLADDIVKGE